ncbi:MAG: glycine cleavage system protein R [Actinomycetota bacterium]
MAHFAVVAIGEDRPGIVAALTEALYEVGGNLEDVSSSILRGHFAMMLVVDAPVAASDVQHALDGACAPLGVSVNIRDVEAGAPRRAHATHSLVAYAADRPGIVSGLSRLLADRGINVTDLSCRLTSEQEPVYAMVAELAVPPDVDAAEVEAAVKQRAADLGVDVTFRAIDADTL